MCVRVAARCQELRAIHTVVNIDEPPIAVQALAVFTAITSAAAVVYIEHRNAATGPKLNREHQCGDRGRCWSTVTLDEQKRLFVRRSGEIAAPGRVIKSVRGHSVFSRKFNGLGL